MKPDCAFYLETIADSDNIVTTECRALDWMICKQNKQCKFYKTWFEYKEGMKKFGGLKDEGLGKVQ